MKLIVEIPDGCEPLARSAIKWLESRAFMPEGEVMAVKSPNGQRPEFAWRLMSMEIAEGPAGYES